MFAYEMARLIATSKQFDDAVPLGQAVIHDFIAAGQMHAKLSDHGVESSEKALRLVIFSENTPLSDVTATQTRKQMHASIALKRAACKKALRMCGEGAAEEPLPPVSLAIHHTMRSTAVPNFKYPPCDYQ